MTEPVVLVTVRNRGRLQLTVENVGLKNDTGQRYGTSAGPEIGPAFPVTLEPGQSKVFGYRRDGVDQIAAIVKLDL